MSTGRASEADVLVVHEAAHALACVALCCRLVEVSAVPADVDGCAYVDAVVPPGEPWLSAVVLLAGPAATMMARGHYGPMCHPDLRAVADLRAAWLTDWSPGSPWLTAATLLHTHREALESLTAALAVRRRMSGGEVLDLLGPWYADPGAHGRMPGWRERSQARRAARPKPPMVIDPIPD